MSRTRLSVFIASSLDGYIATRDGSLAWLEEAASSDEDYGYESFLESVDALAMGRGTYDHIAHLDPMPYDNRPVFVFTHRPPGPRDGVTFWQELPRAALDRWTTMGLGRVYVDGGALISDFLAEGLIDDLILTKVPVLLGDGLPLFHPIGVGTGLRLEGRPELAQRLREPHLLQGVADPNASVMPRTNGPLARRLQLPRQ